MSRVVLGVGGGIAAYKAASLLRHLTESGHDVTVVPTASALRFVGAPTWSALSGKPVTDEVWSDVHEVKHVRLGQEADLVVVAPATADLLAKAAHGLADDLLTNVLLTAHGQVLLAPAMHTEMWQHAATRANVATLRERGVVVLDPAVGRLTGADSGPGRLPEPADIFAACAPYLNGAAAPVASAQDGPLAGRRVVISAGGTREAIDPVRFLGNRSSGKQGYALAEVAARRGADVTLVSANVALPAPAGVRVVPVESARQLQEAMRRESAEADVVVMAAAVADFRPADVATTKIKKTHRDDATRGSNGGSGTPAPVDDDGDAPVITLVRNPDILAGLVRERGEAARPLIVGFAAETGDSDGDVLFHARAKLARKGADLLVANEVGTDLTFGKDESTVHLLVRGEPADAPVTTVGPAPKTVIAEAVWDAVQGRMSS